MKLQFLELPPDERGLYFQQAGVQRNISPVLLEKDFWVSWLLGILFNSQIGHSLTFKGGTSLSKVFAAIDRFSEDIDLSLSPDFLKLPPVGTSKNQGNKWMRQAEKVCSMTVEREIVPMLEADVGAVLGKGTSPWFECFKDPVSRSPVVLFHYPSTQPAGFAYLKRSVKIEFGSLTDQQPAGSHAIRPLIADVRPDEFVDWQCEVVALELERSFWEKATILHAEYHRPVGRPTRDRYSRHYADTASLSLHAIADAAISDHVLRDRVVAWKGQFFASGSAHYDLARPGTFRLVPPSERESVLRADYDAMKDMYMSEPRSFDQILASLAQLEKQINAGG